MRLFVTAFSKQRKNTNCLKNVTERRKVIKQDLMESGTLDVEGPFHTTSQKDLQIRVALMCACCLSDVHQSVPGGKEEQVRIVHRGCTIVEE